MGARLEPKTVLHNRWRVLKRLAEGGFGAVYEAFDEKTKTRAALKVEAAQRPNPVLKVEVAILLKLRGQTEHVCGIMDSGEEPGKFNYIVMTLVGRSLADLHKSMPNRRFSESTTVRLGLQCLQGIEELHKIGFLHRDVKPGNFAIGRKSHRRIVYLLDFGLARYFRTVGSDGEIENRPPRESCGFRGTVRYASTNAHAGHDLGRRDDIWSLLYVLIEFQRGQLPWHDVEADNDVARMKRKISASDLFGDMDQEYKEIYERLKKLRYDQKPSYDWCRQRFRDIQRRKKLVPRGPFEWETLEEEGE